MEPEPVNLRILSALVNGGYQGLLLTFLLWLALKLIPRTNAATRHAVGLVALVLVAVLPLVHFIMSGRPLPPRLDPEEPVQVSPAQRPTPVDSRDFGTLAAESERSWDWGPATQPGAGVDTGVTLTTTARRLPQEETKTATIADMAAEPWGQSRRNTELVSRPRWRASLSQELSLGFLGLWILLAALRLGKLTGECWLLRSLKRRGTAPPDALDAAFEGLRRQMGVRRKTRLLVVKGSAAPMAVGYRNPAVVVPANLLTHSAGGELEPILRHELAHLRRGDDWSNLIQQILKAVLFFHPGVWWLSRRLTLDREIACDDHVLAAASAPRAYALLLTEFAGRVQYRHCSAAPAGWNRHSQLKERITMILDSKRNASPQLAVAPMGTFITAATLLAVVSLSAAPRLELAQPSGEPANPDAATVTVRASAGATLSAGSAPAITAATSAENGGSSVTIVHSGPRQKPMPIKVQVPHAPLPAAAPVPELPVYAPHPPQPLAYPQVEVQLAHAGPHAVPMPAPGPTPVPPLNRELRDGEFMEQRIERLERMIEDLLEGGALSPKPEAGKKPKSSDLRGEWELDKAWEFNHDLQKELERNFKDFNALKDFNVPKIAEITRQAQRDAQRAVRDANRMAEESKRFAHSWEMRRNILEAQRQALEVKMNQLAAQIDRLEAERDRIEQERDRIEEARDRIEAQVEEQKAQLEQLEEEAEAEAEAEAEESEDGDGSGEGSDDGHDKGPKASPGVPF